MKKTLKIMQVTANESKLNIMVGQKTDEDGIYDDYVVTEIGAPDSGFFEKFDEDFLEQVRVEQEEFYGYDFRVLDKPRITQEDKDDFAADFEMFSIDKEYEFFVKDTDYSASRKERFTPVPKEYADKDVSVAITGAKSSDKGINVKFELEGKEYSSFFNKEADAILACGGKDGDKLEDLIGNEVPIKVDYNKSNDKVYSTLGVPSVVAQKDLKYKEGKGFKGVLVGAYEDNWAFNLIVEFDNKQTISKRFPKAEFSSKGSSTPTRHQIAKSLKDIKDKWGIETTNETFSEDLLKNIGKEWDCVIKTAGSNKYVAPIND